LDFGNEIEKVILFAKIDLIAEKNNVDFYTKLTPVLT
jgi:hypothetical protein